ncbi:conjugative transposon protein TraK [Algoriphagus formosus]|uniref:Conjugative transposon protein TraK n=1 Tax=Algoriphagus formosus TaxID=2007308 RepID=A0A4R5VF19_9BACT|nr:conjugative transposon protein TraK [Algoriphagus aquimaris]TDK50848.1 conjugative transposon protein TraK [Algoriphagus aquimaris]
MLRQLKELDTAFLHLKFWTLILISVSVLGASLMTWISWEAVHQARQEVYLISQDQVLKAFANPREAVIRVEAEGHLRQFHRLLFNLSPDERLIEKQLEEALYLGDKSVQFHLDNLREEGYFKRMMAANVSQRILLDSIVVDESRADYPFRVFAKQEIVRSSTKLIRSLITGGNLRLIQRSPANPHGFLIENWEILENKDLKQLAR